VLKELVEEINKTNIDLVLIRRLFDDFSELVTKDYQSDNINQFTLPLNLNMRLQVINSEIIDMSNFNIENTKDINLSLLIALRKRCDRIIHYYNQLEVLDKKIIKELSESDERNLVA